MTTVTSEDAKKLTFILIGSIGSGKSSTGNSILGNKVFKCKTATVPVTKCVQKSTEKRFDLKITVIDTPGLIESTKFPALQAKIQEQIDSMQAVNVVYVITIKIGRYTEEEEKLLTDIFKYKAMLKNGIIIFTNKDELSDEENPEDKTLDTWIKKNPSLDKLIRENKLDYFAFENKYLNKEKIDEQVKEFISICTSKKTSDDICSVSDSKKKKTTILVDRATMFEMFGEYGLHFFDEQDKKQNH